MAALVWHREPLVGEACAAELRAQGHEVGVTDTLDEALAAADVDILVIVAAGVAEVPMLADGLLADVEALVAAHLPAMVERGAGRVVLVAGATGLPGQGWADGVGAAMWGIVGLARTAARSVAASGVTVNVVRIGHLVGPDGEPDPAIVAETPLKRAGTPDDVAAAVGYLVSPDAAYTTGLVLPVDGGATIGLGA